MKKIKSDPICCLLEEVLDSEDSRLLEELNDINGIELLLAAEIMAGETDIEELVERARHLDRISDFSRCLANGNPEREGLLEETKDHLKGKYPSLYTFFEEDIYGRNGN